MSTHLETIVIGAGQAGLATAYELGQAGRDCLVLDGASRVGDHWRHQWDSLRLYSPARYDSLPGLPFPGDPWHFPGKDEVADYLETYARQHALPVRLDTRVSRLSVAPRATAAAAALMTLLRSAGLGMSCSSACAHWCQCSWLMPER